MKTSLIVQWTHISIVEKNEDDYISLTDIAKYKNPESPADVIKNWIRNKNTIEFLGLWEQINNPDFKPVEFDQFKNEAGSNAFVLSPKKWIDTTGAIGIISKSWNAGWTYTHKDIAFEFASWISAEFKLYIIKEFQRLKQSEDEKKSIGWDIKRELTKVNYRIQTDSIKHYLIPTLSEFEQRFSYADEADLLNLVLFGKTAKQWREENPDATWNIRDYADIHELVILINLENFNADFIKKWLPKNERFTLLREITETQMQILLWNIGKLSQWKK